MKIVATLLLLLILSALPAGAYAAGSATGTGTPVTEEGISSNILTETASATPRHVNDRQVNNQPPGVSALDLSLFGVISLGVIGLFWIRRHTSEF